MQHIWEHSGINTDGKWENYRTVIQLWKCKNCGIEKERPLMDPPPSDKNCDGVVITKKFDNSERVTIANTAKRRRGGKRKEKENNIY